MKIAVHGKGNVGGGLADLWERAGHQVKRLGREGGERRFRRAGPSKNSTKSAQRLRRATIYDNDFLIQPDRLGRKLAQDAGALCHLDDRS